MTTTTHPHPALIEPRNWCTNCRHHTAEGSLCPVCRDDIAHGIVLLDLDPDQGKGTQ